MGFTGFYLQVCMLHPWNGLSITADDEFNPQEGYEVVRTLLLDRLQK